MRTGSAEGEKEAMVGAFSQMWDELAGWRQNHPEASLDEIAWAVTKRRRVLLGGLVGQLAEQGGAAAVSRGVTCPGCGQAMSYKGQKGRTVSHYLEGEIELVRDHWYCPECEVGFFPPGCPARINWAPLESGDDPPGGEFGGGDRRLSAGGGTV